MVDLSSCQTVRYANGGLKTGLKNPVNVQNYSNGLPIRVTSPFEYWTPIVSGILLSGIGMVTVMFLLFV